MRRIFSSALGITICLLLAGTYGNGLSAATCEPTRSYALGPFYIPNVPIRSIVGTGYALRGVVRMAKDCNPVAGAMVEPWLTGPNGEYDDAHRATIITNALGTYRFKINVPNPYYGRPPHIHLRVSAKGITPLVTQHCPANRTQEAVFDIVLVPSR
jgi:hypothetical protein